MRWFKHFTDALDDSFIHALMDKFGHSGYALWFGLIEIIAKENGNYLTGKATLETVFLRRKLRVSRAKLEKFLSYCGTIPQRNLSNSSTIPRLSFSFSEKLCQIEIPNMVLLKDNYTKDLQGSGGNLAHHIEGEVEGEVEGEEENTSPHPKLLKVQGKRNPKAEALMKLWNDTMMDVGIPQALTLTEVRKKKIVLRNKDWPMSEWIKIFKKIHDSDFCNGSTGWKATFDWIIANEDNAVKVLEGKYDNPPGKEPSPGAKRDTALDHV